MKFVKTGMWSAGTSCPSCPRIASCR